MPEEASPHLRPFRPTHVMWPECRGVISGRFSSRYFVDARHFGRLQHFTLAKYFGRPRRDDINNRGRHGVLFFDIAIFLAGLEALATIDSPAPREARGLERDAASPYREWRIHGAHGRHRSCEAESASTGRTGGRSSALQSWPARVLSPILAD